ncbi:Endonuclease MutS2 [Candidatus Entotheonellaceae bacterium PAL068K]
MNEHTEAILNYTCIKREIQSYTVTPVGKALAARLRPLTDAAVLDRHLQETSEMVARLSAGEAPPLTPLIDLSPHLAATQIEGLYLEGSQLLEVAEGLGAVQRLRRYTQHATLPAPLMSRRLARLADVGILLRQIRHAIDEKGQGRDHASDTLQHIRQTLKRLRERIHTELHDLMTAYRQGEKPPFSKRSGCCP